MNNLSLVCEVTLIPINTVVLHSKAKLTSSSLGLGYLISHLSSPRLCYVIVPSARAVMSADLALAHSLNRTHTSKCESLKLETSIKGFVMDPFNDMPIPAFFFSKLFT